MKNFQLNPNDLPDLVLVSLLKCDIKTRKQLKILTNEKLKELEND
jgi:hypothetical protein